MHVEYVSRPPDEGSLRVRRGLGSSDLHAGAADPGHPQPGGISTHVLGPRGDTAAVMPMPEEVDVTQFDATISTRILAATRALDEARSAGDDYLADVHLGELESLARVAADHGLVLEGVAETLAAYGITTPSAGVHVVDLTGSSTYTVGG